MKGFILLSETAEITFDTLQMGGGALAAQQQRLAQWYQLAALPVAAAASASVITDPGWSLVLICNSIPEAPGDLAFHTMDPQGRPLCKIGWEEVKKSGGGLCTPDGLFETISHELCECRVNPDVGDYRVMPNGKFTPRECCDWVQGSGYRESGCGDVYVANFVGPRFFTLGAQGPFDARSDFGDGQIVRPFQSLPGGYHEELDPKTMTTTNIFGARVPQHVVERVNRLGIRGVSQYVRGVR